MFWPLVALVLCGAPPLEEDNDFREGARLVDELDYERAVYRFQKLSKSDRPAEQRAVVNAWLGLTYANLGDEREAVKTFVVAIKLDPLVALPLSSPKVAQIFEQARKIVRDELRTDTDNDGVPDAIDKCPALKETANGVDDSDGCPDSKPSTPIAVVAPVVDGDGDGVPDVADGCPAIAGEAKLQGCPAPAPAPKGLSGLVIGGGIALGLGTVGIGAGVMCALFAQQQQQQAEAAPFQDDRQQFKASADNFALSANVGYAVGGSLVTTGAVLVGLAFAGDDA